MIERIKKYPAPAAGLITGAFLLLIFFLAGILTQNGKCILVCDMYGQYYDFLLGIKKIILEQRSLIYSWNLDMGMNMFGWIAYYVASPFNCFLLFVPDDEMIVGITMLIVLKLASAAMGFSVYAKRVLKTADFQNVFFSVFYGLSGFAVTYFFHIFWLDAVILLPLLVSQLKEMLDTGKWIGLTILFWLLFVTCYYTAYMTGIFIASCCLTYYIYREHTIFSKKVLKDTLLFARAVVVAAALSAALLLPVIHQMLNRLGEGKVEKSSQLLNFTPAQFYENAFMGSYTTLVAGNPLIYCGIATLILISLYFLNKEISRREKCAMGFLFLLWFGIMICPVTDLIMHLGNNPTWFLYRYSFVFIFLMCTAGVRQAAYLFQWVCHPRKYRIIQAVILANSLFVIIRYFQKRVLKNVISIEPVKNDYFFWSLGILTAYFLILAAAKYSNKHKKVILFLFCLAASFEVIANGVITLKKMDEETPFKNYSVIKEKQDILKSQLKEIESDKGFYRIDKNYLVCFNDGIAYGYNSLTNFSSVYNKSLHYFLQNLGIYNADWKSFYAGSTAFTDSILSLKYILHGTYINHKGEKASSASFLRNDYIEKNSYWLPAGFMVSNDILDYNVEERDDVSAYEKQKQLLVAMTGDKSSGDCFGITEPESVQYFNMDKMKDEKTDTYQKICAQFTGRISYVIKHGAGKSYYYYPQLHKEDNIGTTVKVETENMRTSLSRYVEPMSLTVPYNVALFANASADTDTLTLKMDSGQTFSMKKEWFYYFDTEKYKPYYKQFKKHGLHVTKWDDGRIEGTVMVGKNPILYLSIPYNDGWKIYVDGKEVKKLSLCSGSFLGVRLTGGMHKVQILYQEPLLKFGIVISMAGTLFLLFYTYITKIEKHN